MGVPGVSRFGGDMGKARAGRWIGNANQNLTAGALDLPAGEVSFAF
jgi:hypothetical protein